MAEDARDRIPAGAPATPFLASTVIVLRPGPRGPEVLLVGRAPGGYVPGDWVFPGGRVDAADRESTPLAPGIADCARSLGLADPACARGLCLAALRELSEESGLLLARDRSGRPAGAAAAAEVRAAASDGAGSWHAALAARGLVPATDLLAPFAHWVTPEALPRRFDTWFFAARAPEGQEASIGAEVSGLKWIRPADAVAQNEPGGDTSLPPPTLDTMLALAEVFESAQARDDGALDALLAAWARRGPPRDRRPFLAAGPDGPMVVLPGDPLHPDSPSAPPGHVNRFVLVDGRFRRQRMP